MNFQPNTQTPPTTILAAEGVCVTCIFDGTNQGEALYIINSEGIAYHQHEVLHLIKPQEKYTLTRDEIQPQRG